MRNKIDNLLLFIGYLKNKINSYRIYFYKDFGFYDKDIGEIFTIWQRKYNAYKKDKNNIIKTQTYQKILQSRKKNSKDVIQSSATNQMLQFHSIDEQDFAPDNFHSNDFFKDYELQVINDLESLQKDELFFKELSYFATLDSINLSKFQKSTNIKSFFSNMFYRIFSLKIFSKEICVLTPSMLHSCNIAMSKSEVQSMFDKSCLLRAKKEKKISSNCEYRFYVNNIKKDCVNFQIFSISKNILNDFIKGESRKLYFLNPFEICSALYFLYPDMQHFTIIFQDKSHHSLCHYTQGLLDFNVVVERSEALQDFYSNIEIVGSVFYVDFSGDRAYIEDYISIESCLNMPLDACIRALSFFYTKTQNIESSFYPKDFYKMRFALKSLFFATMALVLFFILNFFYNEYKYNAAISQQKQNELRAINEKIEKKKNYTPMYDKIYENLATRRSLNFRFKNEEVSKIPQDSATKEQQ